MIVVKMAFASFINTPCLLHLPHAPAHHVRTMKCTRKNDDYTRIRVGRYRGRS